MGINIKETGYQFENRENLRNTAKDILSRQGMTGNTSDNFLESSVFDYDSKFYSTAQRAILKASSQISISSSLKETLKYLKSHSAKKVEKEPVLGELWNLYSKEKRESNDILELEIDYSAENIFAA